MMKEVGIFSSLCWCKDVVVVAIVSCWYKEVVHNVKRWISVKCARD